MHYDILFLIDPITILERPLGRYKIMPGDVLNLAVVADTDPSLTLQYKWMFTDNQGNEKEIESNEYWKFSRPINNNLTIDVRLSTDPGIVYSLTGDYKLKIYHNYDQKFINVTIETDIITTGEYNKWINSQNDRITLYCTCIFYFKCPCSFV